MRIKKPVVTWLSVFVVSLVISQIPQNAFGAAPTDKRDAMTDSVCASDKDGAGLWNALTLDFQKKQTAMLYCRALFESHLGVPSTGSEDYKRQLGSGDDVDVAIARVTEHVQFWSNAASQPGPGRTISDANSFFQEFCETTLTADSSGLADNYIENATVRTINCDYTDGTRMKNPYCYIYMRSYNSSGYVEELDSFVECFSNSADRDSRVQREDDASIIDEESELDPCYGDIGAFGLIICPAIDWLSVLVDELWDAIIDSMRWRVL